MKRQIINYPEFWIAAEELFSPSSLCEYKAFTSAAMVSKQRRKEKLAAVSVRLREMMAEIEKIKTQIRKAAEKDDKKEQGIRLNQLISAKTVLLKTYREEKNQTAFAELSEEAKICACTQSLLKKYLLTAFVKSSPEAYHLNNDGTITLDVDFFRNSVLYQQSAHLKDYVASYIRTYPHRINGSRYFVGLHKKLLDFDDVLNAADEYFDELNQNNEKTAENLQKSRLGIEVIEVYPEYQAQAVRLLTKEALQYEGREMEHCVATYSEKVKNGTTQIYSLRDNGDEYTEFTPHATIEFQDGKIKQIKGFKDSLVDMPYIKATRCLVKKLLHLNTDEEIVASPDIPSSEKNNIGFLKDTKGTMRDIFGVFQKDTEIVFEAIRVKANRIKYLDFSRIKFKKVTVIGAIMPKTIYHLFKADNLEEVNLIFNNEQSEEILNLSALHCRKIELEFKKQAQAKTIRLPQNLQEFKINQGDMPELVAIDGVAALSLLSMFGKFNKLEQIPDIRKNLTLAGEYNQSLLAGKALQSLKKIKLTGNFNLPDTDFLSSSAEKLELREGTFDYIKKLDFLSNSELLDIDLHKCVFPQLKEIIVSENVKNFSGAHSVYPALEKIDLSLAPRKSFGVLEQDSVTTMSFKITHGERAGEDFVTTFPDLGGNIMNFSMFPALKELIFREDIEKIGLTGIHFGAVNPIDFGRYKKLSELNTQFAKLPADTQIDLSQNTNLNRVIIDLNQMPAFILPATIEELNIRREKPELPPENLDLQQYPCLKTLKCDFYPRRKDLPASVENLNLCLMDDANVGVKEFDFSYLRRLDIRTSMNLKLPNLERLALPESFASLHLFNLSPHLAEIDLSKTKGEVEIVEMDFKEEVRESRQKIYLLPEQFQVIKKIKISSETALKLPPCAENLPILIELPANAADKEQELKQKYPHLQIVRKQLPMLSFCCLPNLRAGRL